MNYPFNLITKGFLNLRVFMQPGPGNDGVWVVNFEGGKAFQFKWIGLIFKEMKSIFIFYSLNSLWIQIKQHKLSLKKKHSTIKKICIKNAAEFSMVGWSVDFHDWPKKLQLHYQNKALQANKLWWTKILAEHLNRNQYFNICDNRKCESIKYFFRLQQLTFCQNL